MCEFWHNGFCFFDLLPWLVGGFCGLLILDTANRSLPQTFLLDINIRLKYSHGFLTYS